MKGTKVQSENVDGLRYKMIHTKPDGIKLQDFEEKEGSDKKDLKVRASSAVN